MFFVRPLKLQAKCMTWVVAILEATLVGRKFICIRRATALLKHCATELSYQKLSSGHFGSTGKASSIPVQDYHTKDYNPWLARPAGICHKNRKFGSMVFVLAKIPLEPFPSTSAWGCKGTQRRVYQAYTSNPNPDIEYSIQHRQRWHVTHELHAVAYADDWLPTVKLIPRVSIPERVCTLPHSAPVCALRRVSACVFSYTRRRFQRPSSNILISSSSSRVLRCQR